MSESHNLPPGIYQKPGLIVKVLPGGGWIPVHTDGCREGCRHRCPECRMGLGSHLECDPQCEVANRTSRSEEEGTR